MEKINKEAGIEVHYKKQNINCTWLKNLEKLWGTFMPQTISKINILQKKKNKIKLLKLELPTKKLVLIIIKIIYIYCIFYAVLLEQHRECDVEALGV
jgi:hypothetical protein